MQQQQISADQKKIKNYNGAFKHGAVATYVVVWCSVSVQCYVYPEIC